MVNGILYSPKFKYLAYYCAKSGCSSLRNLFIDLHAKELPENVQKRLTVHNAKDCFMVPKEKDVKFVGSNGLIKKTLREKNIENPIQGDSFLSFLKLLKHLKEKNLLNKSDGHVYEQCFGMPGKDSSLDIVKLESFEDELLRFYEKFSTKELANKTKKQFEKEAMHINKTKVKTVEFPVSFLSKDVISNYDFSDGKAAFPPYEAFFTKEAQDLVYEIYKKDFEVFGYSKDLPFSK
jgi:hypothetical protein